MRDVSDIGRVLIGVGVGLTALGLVLLVWSGRISLPRLPGDIAVKRDNFHFYFPVGWCIVASLVLSAVSWIFNRWR